MSRTTKLVMAAVVTIPIAIIAVAALNAPREGSKDYHFPRVVIDATLRPDGALEMDERRTWAFEGDFSFITYTVDWPPDLIENFRVTEGGAPVATTPVPEGAGISATWTFSASDEERTFRIRYLALCAADVYRDAAHLLWQFVGTGHEKATDRVLVRVHLPGAARRDVARAASCPVPGTTVVPRTRPLAEGEVRAWGHGPLGGEVRIPDPQTVELEVHDLPAFTFVEGSILLPSEAVPLPPVEQGSGRAAILAEERRLADEANDLRAQHRFESALTKVLAVLVPLLMLGLVLVAKRRDRVPNVPRHLQEPPGELHPTRLALLWSSTRKELASGLAYRAQLLRLARLGAIEVQAVGTVTEPEDFLITSRRSPEDETDRAFAAFLFAEDGGQPVAMKELRARGPRKELLAAWWERVGEGIRATVRAIQAGRTRIERVAAIAVAAGAVAYGLWRAGVFSGGDAFLGGLVGAPALVLAGVAVASYAVTAYFMPYRLPERLRGRMARWGAFRRFLTEFSTLDEAPALAVVIWERYLEYAVALGVADEVEKQVRALVPAERLPEPGVAGDGEYPAFTNSHWYYSTPLYVSAGVGTAVGWSSGWGGGASGGGGGGGFSGGGGGGGGGTGSSAG